MCLLLHCVCCAEKNSADQMLYYYASIFADSNARQCMYGYVQALCCAMGSSGWVLGKNYSLLSGDALAQATQEGDGITNPADIQEL